MKRSIQRYVPLASLSLALWLAWGCVGNDTAGADLPPVSMSLVTKTSSGEMESTTSARRVVVFDEVHAHQRRRDADEGFARVGYEDNGRAMGTCMGG